MMNSFLSGRTWLDSRNCKTEISRVQHFRFGSLVMPLFSAYRWFLLGGNIGRTLRLTADRRHLAPLQRMLGSIHLLQSNQNAIKYIVTRRQCGL
jgi:hypothetical protein